MKTATQTTAAQETSSMPGPGLGDGMLVDPGWLAGHLHDADLRVVEVDVSRAAYDNWHIDGAALWNVYSDLKDSDYRTVGTDALERIMEHSGIGPDSTVVFYGYAPALGLWLLKLYGHRDVRILDCSRDTWRAEGLPWSTAASVLTRASRSGSAVMYSGAAVGRVRPGRGAPRFRQRWGNLAAMAPS